MGPIAGGNPSLDALAPLLESLAIEPTPLTGSKSSPKTDITSQPGLGPVSDPSSQIGTEPKFLSGSVRETEPTVGRHCCARCGSSGAGGRVLCGLPCCGRSICDPCLLDALGERIETDLWHSLGSAQWVGCLANACRTFSNPEDLTMSIEAAVSASLPFQRTLSAATQARNSLGEIRPRPARSECELAQRLHRSLLHHKLMHQWTEADVTVKPATLFPVRSGFLTQRVPVLAGMLKTESRKCTSCSTAFSAVDNGDEAVWSSVSMAFPGDWTWMVLGRPSKIVLPECAAKHSLDICRACLPKFMFSGLEFVDAMSGSGNYRFVCPLCKHVLSPVQVERISRLIDPSRSPATLSGISIAATPVLSAAPKPAAFSSATTALLGASTKSPLFGGWLSRPAEADTAAQKQAIMSAIVSTKPNVRWSDVAGLTPAKEELQRAIVFPARFPNLYDEKRRASNAILLYGPPGTGKSYLAKAVATEVDHTFFSISSGDVVSKWMGESEKLIRQLFALARESKPSIIFMDEIDALCSNREGGSGGAERGNEHSARMKTEILVQLDGLRSGGDNAGVVVLAATNLPWALDPAFRRRFEPRIHIPLPDAEARRQLFRIHAGSRGGVLAPADVAALAGETEGYSGSDVAHAVRHALSVPLLKVQRASHFRVVRPDGAIKSNGEGDGGSEMYAPCEAGDDGAIEMTWEQVPQNRLREPPVTAEDFRQVLRDRRVKSSVGKGELRRYEEWTREFGLEGSE